MLQTPLVSTTHLAGILGGIYEAALDYGKWREVLREIHQVLRANNVIIILRPGTANSPGLSLIFSDDLYEYADLLTTNTEPTPFDAAPPEQVTTIADLFSDKQWHESAFYRKLCEPTNVFDIMFVDLRLRDGSAQCVRITRPVSAGRFSRADKDFLTLLAPHLKRAIEIQVMLEQSELVHAQYVDACDRMGVATLILDTKGNLLQYNKSAEALLREADGLSLANDRLEASNSGSNRELRRLLNEGLARCDSIAEPVVSNVMPVVRPSGKANLVLFVQSLPTAKLRSGRHRPALTVFIRDPEFRTQAPVAIAQRVYNLTQAETVLTLELVNGLSLDEAAERLNIRRNTDRAHLRSIFAKTGVQRQTTLVRMILNSMVPPGDGGQLATMNAPGPMPGQGSQIRGSDEPAPASEVAQ
jgi:DNA-binding CsgD family transcriptional regulator